MPGRGRAVGGGKSRVKNHGLSNASDDTPTGPGVDITAEDDQSITTEDNDAITTENS